MMNAIELENLSKSYGARRVVNKLNLSIAAGEVFGFLGPNGAGKTTTIRMLIGLIKPTGGTARIMNHDAVRDRRRISSLIAAVTETPTFFEHLSARDNLQTFAGYAGLRLENRRINELLVQTGIAETMGRRVQTFSLGMKQRLGLAVTLLSDPRVIFLDEPANGLDPAGILEMRRLLRFLAEEEKRTIFLSSHLLSEVEQICDHVAIVSRGEIKLSGKVADLLAGSERLSLKINSIAAAGEIIRQHFPLHVCRSEAGSNGLNVDLAGGGAKLVSQIIKTLVENEIDIYEAACGRRSLDDLFQEVTNPPSTAVK